MHLREHSSGEEAKPLKGPLLLAIQGAKLMIDHERHETRCPARLHTLSGLKTCADLLELRLMVVRFEVPQAIRGTLFRDPIAKVVRYGSYGNYADETWELVDKIRRFVTGRPQPVQ